MGTVPFWCFWNPKSGPVGALIMIALSLTIGYLSGTFFGETKSESVFIGISTYIGVFMSFVLFAYILHKKDL